MFVMCELARSEFQVESSELFALQNEIASLTVVGTSRTTCRQDQKQACEQRQSHCAGPESHRGGHAGELFIANQTALAASGAPARFQPRSAPRPKLRARWFEAFETMQ